MPYVYRHIRLDKNIPFYIGIGNDNTYSRANFKHSRGDHWNKIVAKTDYEVEIIFEHDSYDFIKEKEIEFIELYGRSDMGLGTLCNKTNGGDGCLGLVHTDEAKLKMSIPNRGKIISEEQKRKVSEFHKGKLLSENHKTKISESQKGENNSSSKLKKEDIIKIREMYSSGKYFYFEIGLIYNVSRGCIANIISKKSWKHI